MAKKGKRGSTTTTTTTTTEEKGVRSRNFLDSVLAKTGGSSVTVDQFLDIWQHYDKDGNQVLESTELNNFLTDLIAWSFGVDKSLVSGTEIEELKSSIIDEFDVNRDGKISIRELSKILSPEDAFFVLLRLDHVGNLTSGHDYVQVWKKYDKDLSGFIEIDELKAFLRELLNGIKDGGAPVSEKELDAYTAQIMKLFDTNKDNKLSMAELSKMLPARENFVQQVLNKALNVHRLTTDDINQMMNKYDKDGNGYLEGSEITNLVGDILAASEKEGYYTTADVYDLERTLMKACDANADGKLDRRELSLVLTSTIHASRAAHDANGDSQGPSTKRVMQARRSQLLLSYMPLRTTLI